MARIVGVSVAVSLLATWALGELGGARSVRAVLGGASRQVDPAAAALADEVRMTDEGRRLYLANAPRLVGAGEVATECAGLVNAASTDPVGCWRSTDQQIVIYAPADSRLQPSIEVTAAHEMLHAAFATLSPKERADVDPRSTPGPRSPPTRAWCRG